MGSPFSRYTFGAVCLAGLLLAGCSNQAADDMRRLLEQRLPHLEIDSTQQRALRTFYAGRAYEPVWIEPGEPTQRLTSLIDALCGAGQRGLALAAYDPAGLEQALRAAYIEPPDTDTARAGRLVDLELRAARTVLTLADHLAAGSVPIEERGPWRVSIASPDYQAVLNAAAEDDLNATLGGLETQHAGYTALQEALDRYTAIAENGGWPEIPGDESLEEGATGERVRALRRRLAATGDLPDTTTSDTFDGTVAEAVKRFQRRHGLADDGVVGASVLEVLNVPAQQRVVQLEVNLERSRWMPESLGDDYVLVNIPDYHLYGYHDGERAIDMAVIVGEVMNQTPAFADTMQYVIFRPYWNVPPSIATEEIWPEMSTDPGYLARNNYEIVDSDANVIPASSTNLESLAESRTRIRQKPGGSNALGLVKFMFPNQYNIYLHDTPADHLFSQETRDFSHGCIRLERPADFGVFVLSNRTDGDWSQARVEQMMQSGPNDERIDLERPLPVYIVYQTAWVDPDGQVQFRDDLYGQDEALRAKLNASSDTQATCTALRHLLDEIN